MDGRHQQFASVGSIPGNGVSFKSWRAPATFKSYLRADSKHAKCFFTGNDLKEEKGEGNVDEIYCIESVNKGDQDQDGNASEIFDDENSENGM